MEQTRRDRTGRLITETARLRIRELTVEDAGFVLELTNDPAFISNIADKGIRSLDDARQFLREGSWTNQPKPGYGQFGMELKSSGELVGICGLLFRENLELTDIGFALLPRFWAKGLAFEAAEAVLEYGRSELGVDTIVGLTSEDNAASIRLLEKLGMTFERSTKMSDDDPGTVVYS